MDVKVSIIIINYNTYELTKKCIESVFTKTIATPFEIILIDNASTECKPEIFLELFPDIQLAKSRQNVGFAGGNNLGISKANGEYILLLNSDTELLNDAVTEAIAVFEQEADIGVLSGQLLSPDGSIQAQAGRFPSIMREIRELFRLNKLLSPKQRAHYYLGTECDYNVPIEADWVWGAFFLFRKSDLEFFPDKKLHETFFMYGEDMQWCYHFKKILNKRIVVHPAPKILHHVGASDKSSLKGFQRYKEKMLPNEARWLAITKGRIYARVFYLVKSLLYFSMKRNEENKQKAATYLSFACRALDKQK
jgi:GT2 family glycosyltransferase